MTYRTEAEAMTLSPSKKHCYACASVLDVRAELCPRCGLRQPALPGQLAPVAVAVPTTTRSKSAASLLAFFLGGFGGHKFYLGQTGAGIVYLLFFWTFIPAFIAFIELIILLCMSDADFARKYPG